VTSQPDPEGVAPRLIELLANREDTLAVAESHTGGRVMDTLVSVPGASEVLDRGAVTYSYRAKGTMLGVPREVLDEHGAVSVPTARAMATGIRDTAETTWGIATTGIAGPSGGPSEKPVGTTCIGVAYAAPLGSGESFRTASRMEFSGDRSDIRDQATRAVLDELHERLAES
jgi:nicotinamide-nucleotide amidase